ncbi:MAG: hypothetical protein JRI72_08335 [Deltaproteobacteria bacterium]|nr:hypothetical protein [Deltaproteobacteria bacterium]
MFDIEEFYKARERLFKNQSNLHTLSELEEYLSDLDLVCANERSSEIAELLSPLLDEVKSFSENQAQFELNWQYFQQTYYYVKDLSRTLEIVAKMKKLSINTVNVENQSRVYQAESLVLQLQGKNEEAVKLMHQAFIVIKKYKKVYPREYYRALYSYTHSLFSKESVINSIQNMEKCLSYYSKSYSMRGLIAVIHNLLKLYLYAGYETKIKSLMQWALSDENIQKNLLSNLFIFLNLSIGMTYAIINKLDLAIDYLLKAKSKIEKYQLQKEMMYDYTATLKFLCRSYAYQGKFNLSYDSLVELITFMEDSYVKANFYEEGQKVIRISTYYTLLFIFAQLDLDIKNIKDEKLKRVYNYINAMMNQAHMSKELLLDTFDDLNDTNLHGRKEEVNKDEMSITLHQLLLTHQPYKIPEKNVKTIEKMRIYAFDPLYADILLGKIHISMGNYRRFKEIVIKIEKETTDTKAPILIIWKNFFALLNEYIENPDKKAIIQELEELSSYCTKNNFIKLGEEIQMYQRLISSTRTISQFTDKIQRTVFMDIYDNQSKKMVLEYLENKNLEKKNKEKVIRFA